MSASTESESGSAAQTLVDAIRPDLEQGEFGSDYQDAARLSRDDGSSENNSGRIRRWIGLTFRFIKRTVHFLIGLACLVFLLAVVAAIPIVNLLALGFLLRAQGNVVREGRFKEGFPLLEPARRIGMIFLGITIFLAPLRYLGDFASDAYLIDPTSTFTLFMRIVSLIAAVAVFIHILGALLAGGKFRSFFAPWKNLVGLIDQLRKGGIVRQRVEDVSEFVSQLELKKTFLFGVTGAIGVLCWTLLPTILYASADAPKGPQVILTILGGGMLALVASWAPLLQSHFAHQERFSAFRELGECRKLFRKTPFLWTLSLLVGYALSLVLYLFKIVAPPQDALWMMTLVFIGVIYPSRVLIGRVHARAIRLVDTPPWYWRKFWSLVSLLICVFYVFLLFFTRNIGANGKLVLFEQPFLLIPSPF